MKKNTYEKRMNCYKGWCANYKGTFRGGLTEEEAKGFAEKGNIDAYRKNKKIPIDVCIIRIIEGLKKHMPEKIPELMAGLDKVIKK